MNVTECPREQDVLDAIDARRWPDRCDADLRAHVAGCPVCAELGHVGHLLRADHERWWDTAEVPPASLVWWRAQMRARAEAAEAVSRPVLIAQVVFAALITAAGAAWLIVAPAAASWASAFDRAWQGFAALAASTPVPLGLSPSAQAALWLAAIAWLLLVPAAIYFAVRE